MGKPSQFELNTREKLRQLEEELENLNSERKIILDRMKAVLDKKVVLEELFNEPNGQGGASDSPEE